MNLRLTKTNKKRFMLFYFYDRALKAKEKRCLMKKENYRIDE